MATVTERVREHLPVGHGQLGFCTIVGVAQRLAMSTRTLKRHLAAEGTTFSRELDLLRKEMARQLLADPSIPIQEIGERLGYTEGANFTRAFRRLVGQSPAAYRKYVTAPAATRAP